MDKKKIYIVIGIIVVLLIVLLFSFSDRDKEAVALPEEIVSEERKEELESMKDKDFYKESLLKHLGWTEREVFIEYGKPDESTAHYFEGKELYYEELSVAFILSGEEGVVNNIYLYPGAEVLGIKVGMTFDEIEEILGEPKFRGIDSLYGEHTMNYFLGEQTEATGELEIWIDAEKEDGPSKKIDVLWKKYWEV